MPSESQIVAPPIPVTVNSPLPTAKEISKALEARPGNAFGFLEEIVGQKESLPVQALAEVTAARQEESKKEAETPPAEEVVEPPTEVAPEAPAEEETPPSTEEADPVVAEALNGKEENFKNIRKTLGETKKVLKEKEQTLETVTSKLKAYESAEEIPEPIKVKLREQDETIQKLSKYQSIVDLKGSEGYKEKFVKPLAAVKQKLGAIAKDYGIPAQVLNQALEINNARELNTFLSDNFDAVGAIEVKQLIEKAKDITTQAKAAEQEPQAAIESLEEESRNARELRRVAEIDDIVKKSKSAWVKSLTKIKEEGKILELIPVEEDEEFNKKVVLPIHEKAAQEYGKIVKALAESGLTKLDDELAIALSKMVQLAIASSVAINTRTKAQEEAATLRENVARKTKYVRPALGGGINGGSGVRSSPKTPDDAADAALNIALSRK